MQAVIARSDTSAYFASLVGMELQRTRFTSSTLGKGKIGKMLVHLVNTSGDHKGAGIIQSIEPVGPLKISIRCDRKPAKIKLEPEGKICDFAYTNGKAQLEVDQVNIYNILVIE